MSSKDTYYFSHDSNAFHDPKIIKLRAKYGLEGYGFYWAIIEFLRNQPDYQVQSEELEFLAFHMNYDESKINQMLNTCLSIGLLKKSNDKVFSESLLGRMAIADEIRKKRSLAGRKGGRPKANGKQNESKTKALKEKKGKESKEKESKNKGNNSISSEPEKSAQSLTFDYSSGEFSSDIPEVWLQVWIEAYPAVDIFSEVSKAKAWLFANPKKRKKDYKRFLTNWLSRQQEKGGSAHSNKPFDPTGGWGLQS